MVEPRPRRRDTDRRSSLAESVISVRAERKSGPSSSDSSKNSIHDQDTRDGPDAVIQTTLGSQDDNHTGGPRDDAERNATKRHVSKTKECDFDETSAIGSGFNGNPIDERPTCSFYLRGNCAFGNRCRKWHPEQDDEVQSFFQPKFGNDQPKNQTLDPRDTPDSIFQARFGNQGDWQNNQSQPHEAPAPSATPGFADKGETAAVPTMILVDEGGDWSPTEELYFGFDADQQDIRRSPNQELQHFEPGGHQQQEEQEHQHQREDDDWWKSRTPTPTPTEQETEIDVSRDLTHPHPVEDEQELQLQHELLQELSTPMPPMPMSLSTPTETSPSKSYESMRMSTTETSPPPKSWESVNSPSDPTCQKLVDSLKLQLEKAVGERDRFKKAHEEQQNRKDEVMTTDSMRELYKLREDYAKLQMHSIELMERAEACDKDTEKRAIVVRKFRQLEEEAGIQVEEMRSENAKLRLEKNTMYEENRITRDDRDWWKTEHDKQEIIIENGKESLAELRNMYIARERDLEAKHEEEMQKMRTEYENKNAEVDQRAEKAWKEKYVARVEKIKAERKETSSIFNSQIAMLENTNSNYDTVLSTLTKFLSVEASKRGIEFDEKDSRYKGLRGKYDTKPYEGLTKVKNIMSQILKELDNKSKDSDRQCDNCSSKDELMQAGVDNLTMLELLVAREATDRGINVSGDTSAMVHAIINELDVTREELIRCKLSRPKSDKSVGAVTEKSDKGVSTVTEDEFPTSIDETQPVTEDDFPHPTGDYPPAPVTVVIVMEVNEALIQIVESNPNLAPLKVELGRLRARVPEESEQFRSPARLPAITMETRHDDDLQGLDFDRAMSDLALNIVTVAYITFYLVLFMYQLLFR